jgi:hypothetical protein
MFPLILLLLAVPIQRPADFPQLVEITNPADIADLRSLGSALEAFNQKVGPCITAGRPREACLCGAPPQLAALRSAFASVVKQHPGWKDQELHYTYSNAEGKPISTTIALEGYRRQLEALTCD